MNANQWKRKKKGRKESKRKPRKPLTLEQKLARHKAREVSAILKTKARSRQWFDSSKAKQFPVVILDE